LINLKEDRSLPKKIPSWIFYCNNFLSKIQNFDQFINQDNGFYSKQWLQNKINQIQNAKMTSKYNSNCLVFCHNDLLGNNILYEQKSGEGEHGEQDIAHFIDYEYAGWNRASFDIGNHFNEFTGVDIIDYQKYYPNEDFRKIWITEYITNRENQAPSSEEVDALVKDTEIMSLASHLMWGIWAFFQHENAGSSDFNYGDYGKQRLDEMERKINKIFG